MKEMTVFTRTIAMAIALLLTLSGSVLMTRADQTAVANAAQLIEALPDHTGITDSSSEEYEIALDKARKAIYAVAECTDEEIEALPGRYLPFDMYVDLSLLPITENLPTEIPTTDQMAKEQLTWFYTASENTNAIYESFFYTVCDYSTPVIEYDDPFYTVYYGDQQRSQAIRDIQDVSLRIEAYLTTLSEEEVAQLELWVIETFAPQEDLTDAQLFAQEMAKFPEEFTVDNIFDTAAEFIQLELYLEYGYFVPENLNPEDYQKFLSLQQQYQVVMGIYKEELLDILDEEIARICDLEKVETYSQLKLDLTESGVCAELEEKIDAMIDVYDYSLVYKLENYPAFLQYQALVHGEEFYPDPPEEYYMTGDATGNWLVDASDALHILRSVVGKVEFSEAQFTAADVNGNGEVNASDALLVLQYSVSKIDTFPADEMADATEDTLSAAG